MSKTVVNVIGGVVGLVLLIVACALMPTVSVWVSVYSPVWVYLGLFLSMMVAGALLNRGVGQVGQWWQQSRTKQHDAAAATMDEDSAITGDGDEPLWQGDLAPIDEILGYSTPTLQEEGLRDRAHGEGTGREA